MPILEIRKLVSEKLKDLVKLMRQLEFNPIVSEVVWSKLVLFIQIGKLNPRKRKWTVKVHAVGK